MIPRIVHLFRQQKRMSIRPLFALAIFTGLVFCCVPMARTQQRSQPASKASDLAQQNMSQVAASTAEIKAILTRDEGLVVELKRWVAKDATDHGQAFTDTLRANLNPAIPVEVLPLHINDVRFGDACVNAFLQIYEEPKTEWQTR